MVLVTEPTLRIVDGWPVVAPRPRSSAAPLWQATFEEAARLGRLRRLGASALPLPARERARRRDLVETCARELTPPASGTGSMAVDVLQAAVAMGLTVQVVEQEALGCLLLDQRTILVRADVAPSRRRFSIAHELAHAWLARSGAGEELSEAEEERFCDAAAASLLLPDRLLPPSCVTGRDFMRLAASAMVSHETLAIRLAGRGDPITVLRWRRDHGQLVVRSRAGDQYDAARWSLPLTALDGSRQFQTVEAVVTDDMGRQTSVQLEMLTRSKHGFMTLMGCRPTESRDAR